MLKQLTSVKEYVDFVNGINSDPCFSDPTLSDEEQLRCNLLDAPDRPGRRVWGVFEGEAVTGLFAFLVLEDESYMEMVAGLSRDVRAYDEMMSFLKENYQGWQADFVYNPGNRLLHGLLEKAGAAFDTEQQKMVLKKEVPYQSAHRIELYSPEYKEQYIAIHRRDCYWTGEKVAAAPEKFRIILAIEGREVAGYADVTYEYEENEPYDVFVKEEFRRKGYGKAMLAKAVELNRPKDMMLLVDVDNAAAIALYESLGFVRAAGQNSMTAHVSL